jgi:hypothetical protein
VASEVGEKEVMSKSKAATWKQTGEWGKKSRKYQAQTNKGKASQQKILGKAIKEYFATLSDQEMHDLIFKEIKCKK